MSSSDLSITTHRGRNGLAGLEGTWRSITGSMPSCRAHHTFAAHRAYLDHLAENPDGMLYLLVEDARGPRAICPLESRRDAALGMPLSVQAPPWGKEWPLGDFVCAEDDLRAHLVPLVLDHLRHASERGTMLVLGPLPSASRLWEGVGALAPAGYCAYPQSAWNAVDCSQPYDQHLAALSKNFRGNLRKARNKLAALDGVEFVRATDESSLAEELERFFDVEASGWKGEQGTGTAIRCKPRHAAFYRDLVPALGREGLCEIESLYAEGECIGSQLGVRIGGEYEMFKIAYVEGYSRVSPGQMLVESALKRCCADPKIERLNLMSDSAWQRPWMASPIETRMARIGIGATGRALVPLARFRFGPMRRLVRRFRANEGER
ncbi:MAG: GNAT family N-acetyltransferase [Coriobacteriales bacterium]|nr:GNAT family N-acetyltransferase [Coriobacteriales bacterium]